MPTLDALSLGMAFLAGLVSFASPCVLPLVPSYLGFLAGTRSQGGRDFGKTVAFVLGFGTVFVVLGTIFAGGAVAMGGGLAILRIGAGVLVMIMAANLVWDFLPFLNFEKRFSVTDRPRSFFSAFVVGTAFGAGWTPCIGPYLAGILFLAGSSRDPISGATLLVAYSLGLGVPFLGLSLAFERLKPLWDWTKSHLITIKRWGAALMFVMGLLIAFGQTSAIPRFLIQSGDGLATWATENPMADKLVAMVSLFGLLLVIAYFLWRSWDRRRYLALAIWIGLGSAVSWVQFGVSIGQIDLLVAVGSWLQFQGI